MARRNTPASVIKRAAKNHAATSAVNLSLPICAFLYIRNPPMMPKSPATISDKSKAEKNVDFKSCCACCISAIPGWAETEQAAKQQARTKRIFLNNLPA